MAIYRDLTEISELLGVSPTRLRRWIARLEIEPVVRAAHGRHLFDDVSVQFLQGIKEHLDAGWEMNRLIRLFGPSSPQRPDGRATPLEAVEHREDPALRHELQAIQEKIDRLIVDATLMRSDLMKREAEARAMMDALARIASVLSVNTAKLEELSERLPGVLLGRN